MRCGHGLPDVIKDLHTLIITAGHGAFEPRKLAIDGIDAWEGRGLHYFVRRKDVFRGKAARVVRE